MIDLDVLNIDITCPRCGFYNEISFRQARLRDVIICRGCKANIQLDDHMNECRIARQSLSRALARLAQDLNGTVINIKI
jgi:hypothetical protein